MDEVELVENTAGCDGFEPNQFKPENCKKCGKSWLEHKGIIKPAALEKLVSKKRLTLKAKAEKEAAAAEQQKKNTFEGRRELAKSRISEERAPDSELCRVLAVF